MNHEKIPDPTADQAIAKADRQRRLEEKHGIRIGGNHLHNRNDYGRRTRQKDREKNQSESRWAIRASHSPVIPWRIL